MNSTFEKIIQNRGWNRPSQNGDINLPQIMENIEKRLSRGLPPEEPFTLTRFQEKVIEDEQFWRDWESEDISHLVIQGATSAGKTLVSELAILDTLDNQKKAVVLVPLKAMVHERMVQFQRDMPDQKVFGSSSDHLENDERLMHDDYDVVVTVYEKFFAMLYQNPKDLMNKCGLLVVDEMSMLSKDQRGPKLEMLLELIRKNYPEVRIMCLATCDCKTNKICEWLGIEKPIRSTARPVGLEEHILLMNGTGFYRRIPANHEQEDSTPKKVPETVELPQYRNDWSILTKRKNLLKTVVRKIYTTTENARLLIFVGSQSGSANIAKFLWEEMADLFPQVSGGQHYEEFLNDVRACDVDEDRNDLLQDLGHGIAYHHAGMSTTMREIIEEELQKPQSFIKAVVATETLTVGVNMPFDVMIILNHKVPRGQGADEPLSRQEYRNFIGRAGRLGQNNRTGVTYLFVDDNKNLNFYWESFGTQEEITSALTKASEDALAPYYLGLLPNQFTKQALEDLFQKSLAKACKPSKFFRSDELQTALYNAYLTGEVQGGPKGAANAAAHQYEVLPFGKDIAPYALSCDTCINIYWYFYEGSKNGGLPDGITQDEIESDKYLLEILYHICRHSEVAQSGALSFPNQSNQPDLYIKAKLCVLEQLKKLLAETDAQGARRNVLWCEGGTDTQKKENELWCLMNKSNLGNEIAKLQAAMRAVLLLYWTRGMTISEIRKLTQFQTFTRKILCGDIERLAEVVSFHLDAIHKSLTSSPVFTTPEASNAFYALQTRVKYGMPRDLVRLANKHIYGLDRARLLSLMRDSRIMNLSPIQYLYTASQNQLRKHLTPTQYTQLLQALERRNSVRQFDTLLDIVAKDAGTKLTDENRDCLRAIYDWDGTDPEDLYDNIAKLLRNEAFCSTTIGMDGNVHCIILSLGERRLCVGLLEKELDERTVTRIQRFFESHPYVPRLLLVPSKSLNENWDNNDLTDAMGVYNALTLLNTGFLAMVLANTIAMELGEEQMFEFLADARGIYTESETRFCSLSHYVSHPAVEKPRFRLLCGNGISPVIGEMQLALSADKDLQNHDVLCWGSSLFKQSCVDCPAILFLDRSHVTRSHSLNLFLARMQAQQFHNCLLLVDSEVAEQIWNSADNLEDDGCSAWQGQYSRIRKAVVSNGKEAVEAIRQFLAIWKHEEFLIGISYAHYDPNRDIKSLQREVPQLRNLARNLADIYGEHRILFDEFDPARDLFVIEEGQTRSLAAYQQCKFYLILWNCWTKENINCKNEHAVICDKCQKDHAHCIYLNAQSPDDPKVPEGSFATPIWETETILRNIRNHLEI